MLLEMVKNNEFNLSKEIFCKLNGAVADGEALEWGKFRSGMVHIGGTDHKPHPADELDDVYQKESVEMGKIEHVALRAISFFLFGALNQFFYDGNKRTSRLMMNGIFLSNGYPILNIKAKDQLEFNKQMIGFYDTKDATNVLNYLMNYYYEQNHDLGFK